MTEQEHKRLQQFKKSVEEIKGYLERNIDEHLPKNADGRYWGMKSALSICNDILKEEHEA